MKLSKKIIAMTLAVSGIATATAQDALRTGYFMEGYGYRHELNPAFRPEAKTYVSIPVLGNIGASLNSNVGVNNFLYPMADGRLTTFMNPEVDANAFLKKLKNVNHLNESLGLTVATVGFEMLGGYSTVGLNLRVQASEAIPKDLFTFMKLGMTGEETHYNFKNLRMDATALAEIALGHSRDIKQVEGLRVGAKVKFLLGLGNASANITNLDATLSADKWVLKGSGYLNGALGSGFVLPTKAETGKVPATAADANRLDWDGIKYDSFSMSGFGLGFDLGATYRLPMLPDLEVSAALLDLGFVSWSKVQRAEVSNASWEFSGFQNVALDSDDPNYEQDKISEQFDKIRDDLEEAFNFEKKPGYGSRTTGLAATFNLGASYKMPFYKPLQGGFLFTQRINGPYSWTEGRFTAQVTPVKWFAAAISYGASSFGSSFGWMLNFNPKGVNIFLGSDHMFFKVTPQMLPVGNATMNVRLGINVAI